MTTTNANEWNAPQALSKAIPGMPGHVLLFRASTTGPHHQFSPDNGATWTDDEAAARAAFAAVQPRTVAECVRLLNVEIKRLGSDLQIEARSARSIRFARRSDDYDTPWRLLGSLAVGTRLLAAVRAITREAYRDHDNDLIDCAIEAAKRGQAPEPDALGPGEHRAPDGSICSCTAEDRRYGVGCR